MTQILVKSTVDGFRRAGIGFTRQGVPLESTDLTQDQLRAILNEPNLVVGPVIDGDTVEQLIDSLGAADDKASDDKASDDKASGGKASAAAKAATKEPAPK
ncbi:HI1506-related protein [Lysobacter sp. CA199]|uniref:HI1506-related protein n=1 Tax=Lysobacter sp. CA199 TaxID=3455608 RepID=UPI003F8D5E11